jgi:glutamate-ammonia-ligase adenylyltransferase
VRGLHERLFYRPLLSAVAATPSEDYNLTSAQAEARLAAIGFRDPKGALAHIAALTGGVSRRATIQRHLLPVMLQWFADGADPDYGLLTFRRLSEDLGSTHWYLRMLRDSTGAAERLTRVLSGSRFAGELLGRIPESVAWLESEDELRPRSAELLWEETRAILSRHQAPETAAAALLTARRREVLRLAFSGILGIATIEELAEGLSAITENVIAGVLEAVRSAREDRDRIEFAVIGMGRFGGRELGFGSDADVMYVFRDLAGDPDAAHKAALAIVSDLNRLTEDNRLPLDLDIGLRPEGKNGQPVRSLESYRAYYRRWSLTWEAQALLRARGVAGDAALLADFEQVADEVRYPRNISEQAVREVRRIKARVENERLPQGADPTRHLKLGRGSLSDVEWFVQLIQLQHAAAEPSLRTTSTLDALAEAAEHRFVSEEDAAKLRDAWVFASRARSAMTLWTNKTADVLPSDRVQLDGVARLLEYPPGSASQLEQDYLAVTRRARAVFERSFYGTPGRASPTTA